MAVTAGVGLISGLNFTDIVNQLIALQRAPAARMETRQASLQATQAAMKTLEATMLSLSTSATNLSTAKNFDSLKANNSDPSQLSVTLTDGATVGSHEFQTVRMASNQQLISTGFVNADQQTLSAGTITISSGGRVDSETSLSVLNGGAGVRRGIIKITDRSGATAEVDLTGAATINDVLDTINQASGISVRAEARGDKIALTDLTGQSASNLIVSDKAGGHAAADLGISKSVASDTLSGNTVYQATAAFTLSKLNDGNQLRLADNNPDIRITLTDVSNTTLDVDLNGALTLGDVINKINSATGNGGKVTASLVNGRLVLTDNTGGGGANPLGVTDLNGAKAASALGLDATASGNTLTGNSVIAGLNSVLLRNLRGGQGITQLGQITLTDRTGTTATIDLTGAQSLDEVITAINGATSTGNVKLQLSASVNATGNGITVQDTSGAAVSNLIIADVGGGTVAADLGIAVNAAQTTANSGSLARRYVNEATSLSTYAPGGTNVRRGGITIVDSNGMSYTINISDTLKTIGDVAQAIQTGTNGKVTVELNSTGDGFVLVDQAGGAGQLQVKEIGGNTAKDLRILGSGTTGLDGKSRVTSRLATVIDVTASDTLNTLRDKLNTAKAGLSASILDDGSSFAPKRLLLSSTKSGADGRMVIDDGGLGLGLGIRTRGNDAVLRVGDDPATAFVLTSSTNHFTAAAPGIDVDVLAVGEGPAFVDVVSDAGKVADMVKKFVDNYNAVVNKIADLTKFDATTNTRGALQGEGIATRLTSVLGDLVTDVNYGPKDGSVNSLRDLGITLRDDGTLSADSFGLQIKVAQLGDGVNKFFLDATNGFAAKLKKTVESFTDPLTGKFTEETNSLQTSVDNLEQRINTLDSILAIRRDRMLKQFINLETVLGQLQSQQTALGQIQKISAPQTSSSSSSSSG